jgi:uncharacterized repeat protein (TIGR02543 family)
MYSRFLQTIARIQLQLNHVRDLGLKILPRKPFHGMVGCLSILGLVAYPLVASQDQAFSSDHCSQAVSGGLAYTATQVGIDCVVQFSGSGTWTPEYEGEVRLLMVAGGGAGGGPNGQLLSGGGGGGAGELFESSAFEVQLSAYAVSVGIGGAAVAYRTTGTNGGNTIFGSLTVIGGGGGGAGYGAINTGSGAAGGSGGGSSAWRSGLGGISQSVTGVGYHGADTTTDVESGSGGGGGAGGPGLAPVIESGRYVNEGGAGGPGVDSTITGTLATYAAGGPGANLQGKGSRVDQNLGIGFGGTGNNGNIRTANPLSAGNNGIVIVRYTLPFFEITFDSQGGSSVDMQQTLLVASSPSVSRSDYEFQGWFDSASGGTEVEFPYSPSANLTLYAQWLPIYTVTFDAQGGSAVDPRDVAKIASSPSTTRANFEFQGWFDSASGGSQISFQYQPLSDVTIYAQWLPIYTVTFDAQGGSAVDPRDVAKIASSPSTTRANFEFQGWFDSASGGSQISFQYQPLSDVTIYAQWLPIYTVTFDAQGGSAVDPRDVAKIASSPSTTKSTFLFDGWYTQASGGIEATFPYQPLANVTLYAQWIPLYVLSFNAQSGSSVGDEEVEVLSSSPTTTRDGFEFQGWFDAASGGSAISFPYTPASNTTLYAQWLPIYTVTFNTQRGTSVSSQDVVRVTSAPTTTRYGYSLQGWFEAASGGSAISFPYTPASNTTLYAQWIHGAIAGIRPDRLPTPSTIAFGNGLTKKTFEASLGIGASSKVEIPAGAFPFNTVVNIYTMTDNEFVASEISANNTYLVTQIISWTAPDGSVPIATEPVIMTVTDPSIVAGARIFKIMDREVTQIGVAEADGVAIISFTEDPLITVAITAPDAPTSVAISAITSTTVNVSWTAPIVDGGDSISGYTVTASGGQTCTSSSLSCQINGLSAGGAYRFTVVATNSIGTSPSSDASVEITTTSTQTLPSSSSAGSSYAGPTVLAFSSGRVSAGKQLVMSGKKLNQIISLSVDGVNVEISVRSDTSITLNIPPGITLGTKDLVINHAGGKLTALSAFEVVVATVAEEIVPKTGRLTAIAMKGFVLLFAKDLEGKKLSAKVAGKWLKIEALDSDFERVVRKTGAARRILVDLYIDRVWQVQIELITK